MRSLGRPAEAAYSILRVYPPTVLVARPAPQAETQLPKPRRGATPFGIGRWAARSIAVVVLAAVTAILASVAYPSVLGHWEDETSFRMMTGTGPSLRLALSPRGNIDAAGQYAPINLGYYTAEWLGWSLQAFRLPVLIAGAGSVAIFTVIAGRSFGFWPGLFGGLTLALNPMILLYWHQLIVPMLSMFFMLLVIERYQQVERRGQGGIWFWLHVITLSLAFAFLLLLYAVGRVYGLALVGYWAGVVGWRALQARRSDRPVDFRSLLAIPVFLVFVAGFFVLLDRENIQYLTVPHQIFFPPIGEYARGSSDLSVVLANLPIMLTMIASPLNLAPDRFGEFSTDLMVDHRYALVPVVMLPLVAFGLGVLLRQIRTSEHARLTLFLLAVTCVVPLFSAQVGPYLSIATYRAFYTAIPLYLCAAAGAGWLLARSRPALRWGAAGLLLALVAVQAVSIQVEIARHRAFIVDLAQRWRPDIGPDLFDAVGQRRLTQEDEYLMNGSYRHYVDGGVVPSLAVARQIAAGLPSADAPGEIMVVRLDGTIPGGESLGTPALVFYLHELGLNAAMFDARLDMVRGSGWKQPTYVLAVNERAARAARDKLRASGLAATIHTVQLNR